MEKDIDRISKNPETDIVVRVDDFGGKVGLTIREFVRSERYTGFTKAGTRIPADKFKQFKDAINSIDESDLVIEEASGEDVGVEQESTGESESDDNSKESSEESNKQPKEIKEQAM